MMIFVVLVCCGCGSKVKSVSDKTPESNEKNSQVFVQNNSENTVMINEENQEITDGRSEEIQESVKSFYGILIDEDCSDFEDPPKHDLPCMLMYSCRDSGYGLNILQDDGPYEFIMFNENGQKLSWDYLNKTTRMNGLYVTVTGIYEDGVIKVQSLIES